MKRAETWYALGKLHAIWRKLQKKEAPQDLIDYIDGAMKAIAEGEV